MYNEYLESENEKLKPAQSYSAVNNLKNNLIHLKI